MTGQEMPAPVETRVEDERRLTAQWVHEHGVRDDWAPETTKAYLAAIAKFRSEVGS